PRPPTPTPFPYTTLFRSHHPRDAEHMLGDLRCHDVAIVALRGRDERIRPLDAGALEHFLVDAVAQQGRPFEIRTEATERRGFQVDRKSTRLIQSRSDLVC